MQIMYSSVRTASSLRSGNFYAMTTSGLPVLAISLPSDIRSFN